MNGFGIYHNGVLTYCYNSVEYNIYSDVLTLDEMIELDKQMLARAEEHIKVLKNTLDSRDNPNYKNLDPDNVKFMDQQDEELLNFYLQIKSIYLNRIKHFENMKKGE